MNHRQHMEAFKARGQDEGCTTCHAGVVHDEPIKGYPIVIPRGHVSTDSQPWYPTHPEGSYLRARALGDCFRCHDGKAQHGGKTLDRKCETCHIPEKISGSLLFN
jgi:cytochrome c nitrite reductase small subunit